MKTFVATLIITMCIGLGACSKSADKTGDKATATETKKQPAASAEGHAAHGVEPGSHEDWCSEHGVPESQCTQCDPSLIAAFKATNDWCEEHGVPESQCKKCNPDLVIERPAKK